MRILTKVQRLCVSMVLGGLLCAGAGCSCAEDEYDAVDSCDKVVEAVNAVLTQAQRPTLQNSTALNSKKNVLQGFGFQRPPLQEP